MDLLMIGLIAGFFVLSWALIIAVDHMIRG